MKLLGVETSGQACSVGILIDDKIINRFELAPMRQAQIVLPMIEHMLQEAGIKLGELDALCFGSGPGSFTGVRLATSVVQGIGFASRVPTIPISSLAILAQSAFQALGWQKLWVAVDARMQEVYWGEYGIVDGLAKLIGSEAVIAPDKIPLPSETAAYGIGNGWDVYQSDMTYHPIEVNSMLLPQAESLLLLAKQAFLDNQQLHPREATPTYLRNKVANRPIYLPNR